MRERELELREREVAVRERHAAALAERYLCCGGGRYLQGGEGEGGRNLIKIRGRESRLGIVSLPVETAEDSIDLAQTITETFGAHSFKVTCRQIWRLTFESLMNLIRNSNNLPGICCHSIS